MSITVAIFCFAIINRQEWAQSFESLNAELERLKVKTKLYEDIVIPGITIKVQNFKVFGSKYMEQYLITSFLYMFKVKSMTL